MKSPKKEKYLYPRGNVWWVKIPMGPGTTPVYESTGVSMDSQNVERVPKAAIAFRDQRLAEKHRNELRSTDGQVLIDDLLDATIERWNRESIKPKAVYGMTKCLNANIRPVFGKVKAARLTTAMLEDYREQRGLLGKATATINRELAYLRAAFHDGRKTTPPKVRIIPYFPMRKENNAKQGFLEEGQYKRVLAELPEEIKPALIIGYHLGMRLQEVLHLNWEWFTKDRSMIFVPSEIEKAERGRGVPVFNGAVKNCVEALWKDHEEKRPDVPWLIHRNGRRALWIKASWKQAVIRAGMPDLLFHDLRRSAARNMCKAGIPRPVIMKIMGHVTESMFLRYRIVADGDLQEAGEKLAAYHAA